jgi:hypothetical protein
MWRHVFTAKDSDADFESVKVGDTVWVYEQLSLLEWTQGVSCIVSRVTALQFVAGGYHFRKSDGYSAKKYLDPNSPKSKLLCLSKRAYKTHDLKTSR